MKGTFELRLDDRKLGGGLQHEMIRKDLFQLNRLSLDAMLPVEGRQIGWTNLHLWELSVKQDTSFGQSPVPPELQLGLVQEELQVLPSKLLHMVPPQFARVTIAWLRIVK